MKKVSMLIASLFASLAAFAGWTKPDYPTAQPLTVGAECYLLNIDADGFLVGANDWGTRASYESTHGHKVTIQKFESEDVAWDNESYFITNYVEQGGMANQTASLYLTEDGNVWVDQAISVTASDQGFTFESLGDNVYKIGFAKVNKNYSYETSCYGAYLGGIPEMNDNRLYICQPGSEVYDVDTYQVRWIFVTPADYATYIAKQEQYEAAVSLGEAIDKALAENEGIDVSEVQAVYNNLNSTAAQLAAAEERLTELVIAFQTSKVSAETPADYTPYIANAAYDDGTNSGWSGTGSTVNFGVCEIYSWGANTFNYYQNIKELPEGIYRVSVTGYYRSGTNAADYEHFVNNADTRYVDLYVTSTSQGTYETPLPLQHSGASETALHSEVFQSELGYVPNSMVAANAYFQAGQYQSTGLLTRVTDGALTIGLKKEESETDNWAIWDNWKLQYLGTGLDAYQVLAQERLASHPDYKEGVQDGTYEFYQHSAYDSYVSARETLETATEAAVMATAISDFETSVVALAASIEAYEAFNLQFQEAQDWLYSQSNDSEETDALADYLDQAAVYLEDGPLSAAEITAEIEKLKNMLYDAKASGMADGDDCTSLLANANLTEAGGWTSAVGPTWPVDGNPVAAADNMVFDVYQDLVGLQNGLYEFTTYDVYRPADAAQVTGAEEYKAYIYINTYKKLMNPYLSGVSETQLYSDDASIYSGGFAPNSAAGANAYFQAGLYKQTVYGLVTDGTMRIGYRNDLRYADGSRAWWGPAKLIFRAKNAEALKEVIDMTISEANALTTSYCGTSELTAMGDAIDFAGSCEEEERYDALISLKAAMAEVDTCTVAYENLAVALTQLGQAIVNAENADEATIDEAQAAFDDAETAYNNRTYTRAEAEAAIETLSSYTVAIKMGKNTGSEDNPVDVSNLIVNNTFDPARGDKSTGTIEGWTTSAMNGYKENTVSYNRAAITLYQKLTGLPKGKYKVTVHTYYRAGYYNEEETRIANGEETHLTTLYAETSEKRNETAVMNLTEGASDTVPEGVSKYYTLSNGKFAPDGTSPTVAYFNSGYYLNELTFMVPEDGEVTIGLQKTQVLANDYEVVGAWNLYYMGDPEEMNETDVSSLIVNNTFDPDRGSKSTGTIEGWTTSAMNGYKENSVSYNRAGINLYQDLSGLPEGTYKVTVHTYYRAGYYNEEETRIANGEETHLTTMYARTSDEEYAIKVMNLSEGASDAVPEGVSKYYTLSNGKFAPDGTSPTVAYFNAGYYLNELPFYVGSDGKVRIGLSKTEVLANDYEVVGEWNLYYYGSGNNVDKLTDGIELVETTAADATPVAFYNLSGMRLSQPQRGINIIRMSDGTARKVMIQ